MSRGAVSDDVLHSLRDEVRAFLRTELAGRADPVDWASDPVDRASNPVDRAP
ncbi:hypothetical protein [Gordonia sp. HS-NH1]|uniref:hypothetical protein n=1 Tax=Gordonia sp. HS-NH1 TaxID=1435068 RepID=UPI000B2F6CCC|nr:hypothetical protein [Gordonia sp. HS-NH1]